MGKKREFALYKGDEFVDIGYIKELSKKYGMTEKCLYWRAYCNRWRNADHLYGYIVIPLEEDDEDVDI